MAETKIAKMTIAEFLDWDPGDGLRYELVGGVPYAMTGAKVAHDRVVVRTTSSLLRALDGKPCEPRSADIGVRIPNGNLRRPDVTVDCGPTDPSSMVASEPRLVVEVLSPSTRMMDQMRKTIEYKSVSSIDYILLLDPDEFAGILHVREGASVWREENLIGPDTAVDLPALAITLTLADLYPARS